eukprot:m.143156 g.143156  ORF g.143156 m.143156 type:complete len:57 (+) comp11592_c0_seq13:376-546(+)
MSSTNCPRASTSHFPDSSPHFVNIGNMQHFFHHWSPFRIGKPQPSLTALGLTGVVS